MANATTLSPKEISLLTAVAKNDAKAVDNHFGRISTLDTLSDDYKASTVRALMVTAANKGQTKILKLLSEGLVKLEQETNETTRKELEDVVGKNGKDAKDALATARQILEAGFDVNTRKREDEPPSLMHIAAYSGTPEMLELLVKHGAKVDQRDGSKTSAIDKNDNDGATPLHIAALGSNTATARWLLEHGAKANAIGAMSIAEWAVEETPLEVALRNLNRDRPENIELLALLKKHGADLNQRFDKNRKYCGTAGRGIDSTPIYTALGNKNFKMAQWLVENGADMNVENEYGRTPLHTAAYLFNNAPASLIKSMIEKKAPLNKQDTMGKETALHLAAANDKDGAVEVVKVLLEAGADRTIKNAKNETPLDVAKRHGNKAIIALLERTPETEQSKRTSWAGGR